MVAKLLNDHGEERLELVRLLGGLVPADAVNAGKRMATPDLCRVERCTESNATSKTSFGSTWRAHRTEGVHRMIADENVELSEFLVGEAEIGLTHRHELQLAGLANPPGALARMRRSRRSSRLSGTRCSAAPPISATTFDGEASYGAALLGYQFRQHALIVKLFAGIEAEDQRITPRDPDNSVQGRAVGLKLQA